MATKQAQIHQGPVASLQRGHSSSCSVSWQQSNMSSHLAPLVHFGLATTNKQQKTIWSVSLSVPFTEMVTLHSIKRLPNRAPLEWPLVGRVRRYARWCPRR